MIIVGEDLVCICQTSAAALPPSPTARPSPAHAAPFPLPRRTPSLDVPRARHHPVPRPYPLARRYPPCPLRPWRTPRYHHPGTTWRRSPLVWTSSPTAGRGGLRTLGCLSSTFSLDLSLLVTAVPNQVGHGFRRRCV